MAKRRTANDAVATERLGGLIDALLPVLVDRLHETGLGEIEVERDGAVIRVRAEERAGGHVSKAVAEGPNRGAAAQPGASVGTQAGTHGSGQDVPLGTHRPRPARHAIRSSGVGYLTLSKEIHVGAKVAKGALVASVDVLGIANEVRADQGGIVAVLKVTTGDPVEYGQELLLLESVGDANRADANRGGAGA